MRRFLIVLAAAGLLWSAAIIRAQTSNPEPPRLLPPGLGQASPGNRYNASFTEVYKQDFEKDLSGIIVSAQSVALTSAPGEVLAGHRSVRVKGANASFIFRPEELKLQPGRIYLVEYRYKILQQQHELGGLHVVFYSTNGLIEGQELIDFGGPTIGAPKEGIDIRGMRIAQASGITIAFVSQDADFIVDDIRILRQDTELTRSKLPLPDHGFPRIFHYKLTSPESTAFRSNYPLQIIDQAMARADFVTGTDSDPTLGAGAWVRRLKEINPKLQILPYQQTFMIQYPERVPLWGTADANAIFNHTLYPQWYMFDTSLKPVNEPDFPQNVQMNHTPTAIPFDGETFNTRKLDYLAQWLLPGGLWDGFHFDQPEWYLNPLLADKQGKFPPIDLDLDGRAESLIDLNRNWELGFVDYFQKARQRLGDHVLMFGNAGYLAVNRRTLPFLNGWLREITSPYEILPNGEWNTNEPSYWYHLLESYRIAMRNVQAPALVAFEYTGRDLGRPTGSNTANGIPDRVPETEIRDYRRMRFGLTSTLLDDGYFTYDVVDNTTIPLWFDEYSVDSNGAPTFDLSGKGYLGQPLGDGVEITQQETVIARQDFEDASAGGPLSMAPGTRVSFNPAEVISGSFSLVGSRAAGQTSSLLFQGLSPALDLKPNRTYQLTFDYKVLQFHPENYAGFLAAGFSLGATGLTQGSADFQFLPDIEGPGQTGRFRAVVKTPAVLTQPPSVLAGLLDAGDVAIDNIRITEGGPGAWRRDFENGIVLVNPTPETITLSQDAIAGPLRRTNIRRLRGTQDPAWNNGASVLSGIVLPPGDGIVLLAAPVASAPLTQTTQVQFNRLDKAIQLWWRANPEYHAGYVVRYGEDPLNFTSDKAVNKNTPFVELNSLKPGTTYFIQVAAYDYLGNVGPYSELFMIGTTGTPSARPVHRPSSDTLALVPGSTAKLSGFRMADASGVLTKVDGKYPTRFAGTQVLVDGVPVPLLSVSPEEIEFLVPWELRGNQAVVEVAMGSSRSAAQLYSVRQSLPVIVARKFAQTIEIRDAQSGVPITAQFPASVGQLLELEAQGLGLTSPRLFTNEFPTAGVAVESDVEVEIGSVKVVPSAVLWNPERPGYNLVRFRVPAVLDPGSYDVRLHMSEGLSNGVNLAVE